MADIFDLTDEQIAAFAPVEQPAAASPIGTIAPAPLFNIPAPMPTTNYFGGSRLRGLGGGGFGGSLRGVQQQINQLNEQRMQQEAAFQAEALARELTGVDPTQPTYAQQRFELARRYPLAMETPGGQNLLQTYDQLADATSSQQREAAKMQEQMREQQALEERRRADNQFLTALYSAQDPDELDALMLTAPESAARFSSIINNRLRRLSPDATDPVREQNYWLNQQQQARRVLDDPIATKEAKALAEQRLALASQAFSQFAPQTAVGPSQMPALAPAPQGAVNIKSVKPIQR